MLSNNVPYLDHCIHKENKNTAVRAIQTEITMSTANSIRCNTSNLNWTDTVLTKIDEVASSSTSHCCRVTDLITESMYPDSVPYRSHLRESPKKNAHCHYNNIPGSSKATTDGSYITRISILYFLPPTTFNHFRLLSAGWADHTLLFWTETAWVLLARWPQQAAGIE